MTNRTKIDRAYNQAKKLRARVLENGTMCPNEDIRAIAAALRRAYRQGKQERERELSTCLCGAPMLAGQCSVKGCVYDQN